MPREILSLLSQFHFKDMPLTRLVPHKQESGGQNEPNRKDPQILSVRGLWNHPMLRSVTSRTFSQLFIASLLSVSDGQGYQPSAKSFWYERQTPKRQQEQKEHEGSWEKCKKQNKEKPKKKPINSILREIIDDIACIKQEQNDIKRNIQRTKQSS